jgi:hypothetical protein
MRMQQRQPKPDPARKQSGIHLQQASVQEEGWGKRIRTSRDR